MSLRPSAQAKGSDRPQVDKHALVIGLFPIADMLTTEVVI
jgi:hypothetical protein